MLKSDAKLMLKPAKDVLANIKSIAMIKFILGARRAELMRLAQGYDEVFRTFAARVRGKTETCNFTTVCQYTANTHYMENAIKDLMLAGISDIDIRRETLSTEDIFLWSVNEVIFFVESKEIGRNATNKSAYVAAVVL